MHSLGSEQISPPLYLANGVTTVREMAGNPVAYDWRDRIERGTLAGPRMVVGSRIIDGDPTLWDPQIMNVLVVSDPAEARAAVRTVKAEGADFVKMYSRLSPASYAAIVDEARRQRLTIAGHCPDVLPVTTASDAGQRSIEHLHAIGLSVSSREPEIRRMLAGLTITTGDYNGWFRRLHPIEWLAADSYSPALAAEVFGRLRDNGTRVVPTLTMHRVLDMPDDVSPTDERLRYLPPGDVEMFRWALDNLDKPNAPTRRSRTGRRCSPTGCGSSASWRGPPCR